MSKNCRLSLLILTFIINFIQCVFILIIPHGGINIFKHFSYPFTAILNTPEFSNLSDMTITIVNYTAFFLYFGGIISGIFIPFLYKMKLSKRVLLNSFSTLVPLLLIVSLMTFFPSPDNFLHSSSNGFQWEKYEWHRKNKNYIKLWRSEKCDTCYTQKERIKWVLIKKGYESENKN